MKTSATLRGWIYNLDLSNYYHNSSLLAISVLHPVKDSIHMASYWNYLYQRSWAIRKDQDTQAFFSQWNAIPWCKFYWLQIGMIFNCSWLGLGFRNIQDWPLVKVWGLIIIYWWCCYYWSIPLCNMLKNDQCCLTLENISTRQR